MTSRQTHTSEWIKKKGPAANKASCQ